MFGNAIRADPAGEVGLIGPIASPSAVDSASTTSDSEPTVKPNVPPPSTQYLTDEIFSSVPLESRITARFPTLTPRIDCASEAWPFGARQPEASSARAAHGNAAAASAATRARRKRTTPTVRPRSWLPSEIRLRRR